VDAELEQIFQEWDGTIGADAASGPDAQQAILNRLNEILNRRSYIRNLVAGVQTELAGA
jgi:hypothetical protein